MFIQRIVYTMEKDSELLTGYYVGRCDNCEESVMLDKNYQPLDDMVWNYWSDTECSIRIDIPEKEDFEEDIL